MIYPHWQGHLCIWKRDPRLRSYSRYYLLEHAVFRGTKLGYIANFSLGLGWDLGILYFITGISHVEQILFWRARSYWVLNPVQGPEWYWLDIFYLYKDNNFIYNPSSFYQGKRTFIVFSCTNIFKIIIYVQPHVVTLPVTCLHVNVENVSLPQF